MGTPCATGHYQTGNIAYGTITLTAYNASPFGLQMIDTLAGTGKNVTDSTGTFKSITAGGYPAESLTPTAGTDGYINVVIAKRLIMAFHAAAQMPQSELDAAVQAYDFKPILALAK